MVGLEKLSYDTDHVISRNSALEHSQHLPLPMGTSSPEQTLQLLWTLWELPAIPQNSCNWDLFVPHLPKLLSINPYTYFFFCSSFLGTHSWKVC